MSSDCIPKRNNKKQSSDEDRLRTQSGGEDRLRKESGGEDRLRTQSGGEDRLRKESGGEDRLRKQLGGEDRLRKQSGGEDRLRKQSGGEDRLRKQSGGEDRLRKQSGGEGKQGHTVMDSVFFDRPEYGFYSAEEMSKMGAKVGGSGNTRVQRQSMNQTAGSGHQGHTVMDSVFFNRPEYGFYSAEEMSKMGAKVGGGIVDYIVDKFVQKKQKGGYQKESQREHQERIQGLIENMINVSDSDDKDIIEVLQREYKPNRIQTYSKQEAKQMLREYYVFNSRQITHNSRGLRNFPSTLVSEFMNKKKNQVGGNRVVLPLTFFTGEIPNKISIPEHIDNYCAN